MCEKRVKKKKKVKCTKKDPHSLVYQKTVIQKMWVKNSQNIPLPKFFSLMKNAIDHHQNNEKERTKKISVF